MAKDEYVVITAPMPNCRFRGRILTRKNFPTCHCSLSHEMRSHLVRIGDIALVDTTDFDDSDNGTADIIQIISDSKEIKQLRKEKVIPREEDMPHVHVKEQHADKRDKTKHGGHRGGGREDGEGRREGDDGLAAQPEPDFDTEEAAEDVAKDDSASDEDVKQSKGKRLTKDEKKAVKMQLANKEQQEILSRELDRDADDDINDL